MIRLTGQLLDAFKRPISDALIRLKSVKNGEVPSGVISDIRTDSEGKYDTEIEIGSYICYIVVDNKETAIPGYVNVYKDTGSSSLQEFLYAPCEIDAIPMFLWYLEKLRREVMESAKQTAADREAVEEMLKQVGDAIQGGTNIKKDVATGLAETKDGEFFTVPQGTGNELAFITYRNDNGVATPVADFYGRGMVDKNKSDIGRLNYYINETVDGMFRITSNNGRVVFHIDEAGNTEMLKVLNLKTDGNGVNMAGSKIDTNTPEGWSFVIYSDVDGRVIAGVKTDGTKYGFNDGSSSGGEPGQSGVIIPGDTVSSYNDIRKYSGEGTVMEVIGNRINGKFVVNDSDTTSPDDGGGILVGDDGRRWYRQADYVSYDMFGAKRIPKETYDNYVSLSKSGNEADAQALLADFEPADTAMVNAHAYAEKFGIPVIQNSGYFLWVEKQISVKTPCNFNGMTIVTCSRSGTPDARWGNVDGVDDGALQPMYIYYIEGKKRIDLTSEELKDFNDNYSKYLKKSSTWLPYPKLFEHRGGYFGVISSDVELYRGGNQSNPRTQVKYRDFSRIGRNGAITDPLVKTIPEGTIIEAWIQPKEDAWLKFDAPNFFEAGSGRKFVNIQIVRSMVEVNNLVLSNFATGNIESRVVVGSYGVTDLRLNNANAESMPNEVGGAYAICFRNTIEIHVNSYYGLYGWGFQGHHGCKRLFVDNSVMNRFDFHSFGYDINVSRCLIKGRQIYKQGGDKWTFTDNTFVVTQYSVNQDGGTLEYRLGYMFGMREDYAGDCDSDFTIRNTTVRFDAFIENPLPAGANLSFDLVTINNSADNTVPYGVDTKTPHRIDIDGVTFDLGNSASWVPADFAFTAVRIYRARYSIRTKTFLPSFISVKNVTAINVPSDKNAFIGVLRVGADIYNSPVSSRVKKKPDGTNAMVYAENIQSVVNSPVVGATACPMVYLAGDTTKWDTTVDGTTYRNGEFAWTPKITLVNCSPIIINATGVKADFDIHGGTLSHYTTGDAGNRCRVTGSDIQLYPDSAGNVYFDSSNVRTANCDWLDPANGATYDGELRGVGNENRGTAEHSPNIKV